MSETRKRDETIRKTLTFRSERSSMLTIACRRWNILTYMYQGHTCMHVYADPTRMLWRVCRGDSIRKAVRPGVRLLHRASTIQRGENWGCVGVKVDSCWYIVQSTLWLYLDKGDGSTGTIYSQIFQQTLAVSVRKTVIFSESRGEYKMKSHAKHYVNTRFHPQPYFSHKFSVTFFENIF